MNRLPNLTQFAERHLSDEQMYNLLDQPDSKDATLQLHLLTCAACQSELTLLRSSLANFHTAATNLASAQAPALATRSVRSAKTLAGFRRQLWAASFAAAAVLMAVSITLVHPLHQAPVSKSPATIAAGSAESDEALLDGIQRDLSASIPPSLEPLELTASTPSRHN